MLFSFNTVLESNKRNRAARHQTLGLDAGSLLGTCPQKQSCGRCRAVVKALLGRLSTKKQFDLASVQVALPATWLMQTSDSSELVRRRATGLNHKIQEVTAILYSYLPLLPKDVKQNLFSLPHSFLTFFLLRERRHECSILVSEVPAIAQPQRGG